LSRHIRRNSNGSDGHKNMQSLSNARERLRLLTALYSFHARRLPCPSEGFLIFGGATEFGPTGRRPTAIGHIILSGSTIRAYRSFAGEVPGLRGFNFDLVAPRQRIRTSDGSKALLKPSNTNCGTGGRWLDPTQL
jgi:hypothetical protein